MGAKHPIGFCVFELADDMLVVIRGGWASLMVMKDKEISPPLKLHRKVSALLSRMAVDEGHSVMLLQGLPLRPVINDRDLELIRPFFVVVIGFKGAVGAALEGEALGLMSSRSQAPG
jgi:hypothetical protein